MTDLHDLSAVVHVHSTYSDGTATVAELIAAARGSGAGAVLLTDHDTLAARREGWAGTHDGVTVIVGTEVTWKRGHYLAFGVGGEIPHVGRSAVEIAAAVREAGGVGFAAHPFSQGGSMLVPALTRRIVLPHGWPALEQPGGCDGIELWSVTTDAAEGWRTPAAAARWLRDPVAATASGPPQQHLRIWDALSAHRRVPALGGLDGHAPGVRIRGRVRSPLSHARTFGLLRTHLLLDRPLSEGRDPDADEATIVAALRVGSTWLSRPLVAPADGARFWAELADGSYVPMGGEAIVATGARSVLRVRLPRAAELLVVRDGETFMRADGATLEAPVTGAGVYRLEARVGGALWLLSNPVHLRERGR
ncbi:PHP domain-containing protein [Conexibacter sp. CPCC 206217]|uniref:PHP domain-containing protein n=1 Tax=Conexibacter sp. CPCC 206217 TaxID=3064574 RepID=UPI00271BB93B|nr:CehA/McbA family metallohydrolase [Conexibacter sp. CPCC 206217]MDO8212764.1 CehA/McbA family metallohydrolase [Conexibacter sp. CPCC 206217]